MYRNLTLYAGISLIVLSIFIFFGFVSTSTALMLTVSIAACIFSITDLVDVFLKKKNILAILDFSAILIVVLSVIIPDIKKFDSQLMTASNFTTFLGFGLVILSIGLRNSKIIKKMLLDIEDSKKPKVSFKKNMDDKHARQLAKELAIIEHNSVLEYNDIIIDLMKCDCEVSKTGRVHNGWALFYDILVETFNDYKEPFYDMLLNNLFIEFLNELGQAVKIFANASNPASFRTLKKINMWIEDMEISSYNTSSYDGYDDIDEGLKVLASSLEKWKRLKELSNNRYEIYRKRAS